MTNSAARVARFACLLIAAVPASGAQTPPPATVQSLTLKEMISHLDQVDFDMQGVESNISEFRKDFSHGLGSAAAIRVLDIGVALVRDRTALNKHPQMIGAMQRESRWDSLQRSRQDELMTRNRSLTAKHGGLYRSLEAYAVDLKNKYGIDMKGFLDALQNASDRGEQDLEKVITDYRTQLVQGNVAKANEIASQLAGGTTGGTMGPTQPTPPTQPQRLAHGPNDIASIAVDPNDPNRLIITYTDGTTDSVPFTRGPNGELIFTIPGGPQVTIPTQSGPGGVSAMLPGGGTVNVPGLTPSGPAGIPGPGQLPPNVSFDPARGYAVQDENGNIRYFPADLTKPGIGTRYLGDKGTRLREEIEEYLDLSGGGQYRIRQGNVIKWQFILAPVSSQPGADGTQASFALRDSAGQGQFNVTGWRIMRPDGSELAAGTSGDATATFTQSGNYRIEFSGSTAWGSPFRIEFLQPVAVQ